MLMNKLLRFSFVALLALISSVSFAQTTVTFTAGTDKGSLSDSKSAGADQVTKDGITIATSKGLFAAVNGGDGTDEYRVYKGSTFTVTSTVGNITKVVVTCTANGTTKQGPGNFTDATAGEYTFESDGATGTWSGDAATFSLTASKNQVRMTKVEVTVSPATNISNIKADTNADSPLYNLAGQRVSKSYKGVVIKNGQKVLVK